MTGKRLVTGILACAYALGARGATGASPPAAADSSGAQWAVETRPDALAVAIDGVAAGRAPLVKRIAPGPHTLTVVDPCWQSAKRLLARNAPGKITLVARPRMASLNLSARWLNGSHATGRLLIDGRAAGSVPGRIRVPVCARNLQVVVAGGASGLMNPSLAEGETLPLEAIIAAPPPPGMLFISGGTFLMGEIGITEPVTRVTLKPYDIDRTETSVDDYAACVAAGKCATDAVSSCGEETNWGRPGHGNHPMNCVSWKQAQTYCESKGGRLPTEAEWEFAARGTDGRLYPWGNDPASPDRANSMLLELYHILPGGITMKSRGVNTLHSSHTGTLPVDCCTAGASPFGALNMAGNVWEWVSDWYAPYPGGSVVEPIGPPVGSQRVVRGGGYSSVYAFGLRTMDRETSSPAARGRNLGFRCARDVRP